MVVYALLPWWGILLGRILFTGVVMSKGLKKLLEAFFNLQQFEREGYALEQSTLKGGNYYGR